jgi:hypothetical protein
MFVSPTMALSRLQSKKLGFDGRFHLARTWASFIIGNAAVKLAVRNVNLIPLEDGYTFISNHDSKYDGLFLLSGHPLDFSFFLEKPDHLPYMTSFLKAIDSIMSSPQTRDDDLIKMSQGLKQKRNYHLFLNDLTPNDTQAYLLDAAYLTKTAIIPVAIKNSKSFMKFGHQQISLVFCTPIHYEEYGSSTNQSTLNEVKNRLNQALKEGE